MDEGFLFIMTDVKSMKLIKAIIITLKYGCYISEILGEVIKHV